MVRGNREWQGRMLNKANRARARTANCAVRYTKSLKIGAREKKPTAKCDVAHELTSNRPYGEKEWWVVIVKVA